MDGIWSVLAMTGVFVVLYFAQYLFQRFAIKALREGDAKKAEDLMELARLTVQIPGKVTETIGKPLTGIPRVINELAKTTVMSTEQIFKEEKEVLKSQSSTDKALEYLHTRMKARAMEDLRAAVLSEGIELDEQTERIMDMAIEGAVMALKFFRKSNSEVVAGDTV